MQWDGIDIWRPKVDWEFCYQLHSKQNVICLQEHILSNSSLYSKWIYMRNVSVTQNSVELAQNHHQEMLHE